MSLLDEVKNELAAITDDSSLAKQAQVSAMLRFGGGIQVVKNIPIVVSQFTSATAARWLQSSIREIWGYDAELRKGTSTLPSGETV